MSADYGMENTELEYQPLTHADSIKLLRYLLNTKRPSGPTISREQDRATVERHLARYNNDKKMGV